MAVNKNQHYVPRVYLNAFTVDGDRKRINLFNYARMICIKDASIKKQCSGDYFYGKDAKLEAAINTIENGYGRVVSEISKDVKMSAMVSLVLRRFILLQHLRTDAAARRLSQIANVHFPADPDFSTEKFRSMTQEIVISAMEIYADYMHIIDDLKLVLVNNETDVPFVSSDDPAVLTNRLHIQRHSRSGRSFGLISAGAIMLLPLTPKLQAIFYDGDVYSVPHDRFIVSVRKDLDVASLNQHQFMSCQSNIYFHRWDHSELVKTQGEDFIGSRNESASSVTYAALTEKIDGWSKYERRSPDEISEGSEVLIHVVKNHLVPSRWPSFLRFRLDATAWADPRSMKFIRKSAIDLGSRNSDLHRKFKV